MAVADNIRVEDQDGNRSSDDDSDPVERLAFKAQFLFGAFSMVQPHSG